MRRPLAAVCLVAACNGAARLPHADVPLRAAEAASAVSDWPAARRALEDAVHRAPDDPEARRRLADVLLEAYGEVERAERHYESAREHDAAAGLFGHGRCALWRGDVDRAVDLWIASVDARPTVEAALALAVWSPDDRAAALDVLAAIGGGSCRAALALAAAGRAPPPDPLPREWWYAAGRARLATGPARAAERAAYAAAATAHENARRRLLEILAAEPELSPPGGG